MWTFQAKGLLYYHNRVYFHRECVSLYFLHVCETCTSRCFDTSAPSWRTQTFISPTTVWIYLSGSLKTEPHLTRLLTFPAYQVLRWFCSALSDWPGALAWHSTTAPSAEVCVMSPEDGPRLSLFKRRVIIAGAPQQVVAQAILKKHQGDGDIWVYEERNPSAATNKDSHQYSH